MPVHLLKRKGHLKPATTAHFFGSGSVAKVPRSVLDLFWVLLSRKTKPTAPLNLTGDIELVASRFMPTIDNRLRLALNRKVTLLSLSTALGYVKPVVDAGVAKDAVVKITVAVISVLNVPLTR